MIIARTIKEDYSYVCQDIVKEFRELEDGGSRAKDAGRLVLEATWNHLVDHASILALKLNLKLLNHALRVTHSPRCLSHTYTFNI